MRARHVALVALLVFAGSFFSPLSAQAVPRPSLRIATYNSYLVSPLFKCLNWIALDCLTQIEGETEAWAERLADTILAHADTMDVIVLNEVFDEDAKAILARRLRNAYPIQIRNIDAALIDVQAEAYGNLDEGLRAEIDVDVAGEDSGLMLFARRDFSVLPLPHQGHRWGNDPGEEIDASGQVAFTRFEACASDDCLAAKGAAMIRLQHGRGGPIYNVVLTHMQADYPDDDEFFPTMRRRQFAQIETMIRETLAPLDDHLRGQEMVLFLGDLNVPGLRGNEHQQRFRNQNSFFRSPLYEAWHYTSSRDDVTPTNIFDNERLDYIFASPVEQTSADTSIRRFCVQHMTVPHAFRELESDHAMVLADINVGFDHCSPSIARRLSLPPSGEALTVNLDQPTSRDVTRISQPGAMQWFYVDTGGSSGTYTIGTTRDDLRVEIYLPEDMTTAVSRYNTTRGSEGGVRFNADLYSLPSRFFIRVRGAQRTTTANYNLLVDRHTCSSRDDACLLVPGRTATATLSGVDMEESGQLTPQNEAWFRYDVVGTPLSERAQSITLDAGLVDASRITAGIESHTDPGGNAAPSGAPSGNRVRLAGRMAEGANGYVVLKQPEPGPAASEVSVLLDTNIRFLTVGNLTCVNETNPETGSDDIYSRFNIDGTTRRAPGSGSVEFDCDESPDTVAWSTWLGLNNFAFLDSVSVRVRELDDTSADDSGNAFRIPGLAAGAEERAAHLTWRFSGGEYRFDYVLRRRPNQPVADP